MGIIVNKSLSQDFPKSMPISCNQFNHLKLHLLRHTHLLLKVKLINVICLNSIRTPIKSKFKLNCEMIFLILVSSSLMNTETDRRRYHTDAFEQMC